MANFMKSFIYKYYQLKSPVYKIFTPSISIKNIAAPITCPAL